MYRESNLTIFQLDATYSVYYITVGSSTCFGCRTHHQELVVDPVNQYQKLYLQLYQLLMMGSTLETCRAAYSDVIN